MRLSIFISQHKESILQAWENFARSMETPGETMGKSALRDHASLMLTTIAQDLQTPQTSGEQLVKSHGLGPKEVGETYAEIHAAERLRSGFTIDQLVSEYRALRASVLKLWGQASHNTLLTDPEDITRFNEAIDQALAESVSRFSELTTERAEVERQRLNAILEAAPVGIGMADQSGKMRLLNFENKRIWGEHPPSEHVEELADWKAWWADGSARHGQPVGPQEWGLMRALRGEGSPRDIVEIEPFGAPGERRTILLHAEPIRDAIKNVVGSVMAQMDITAQVRMEAALRDSEAKFRTIANAMPQMVWSTLPDGHHDYFNQQWYDFTGVPDGSTDGEGWNGVFHPDDQEHAWARWNHSLATGEVYEIQYRLRHRSGQYRWTLGRALPIRNQAEQIVRWMGTCTDIHDQKLGEELLKRESERKDEFLAMLAHELRNPLAPISTAAQMLKVAGLSKARVHQAGDIITRQVKHMTSLVDDLLDLSRITRGLVQIADEDVDLKLVLNNAMEQALPLIHARKHELSIRMSPSQAFARGDKNRLVQVVANMLNNAAKYTPQSGTIELVLTVHDQQAVICVSDNGSGISADLLPCIFDLFTQGERTPDRAQGGLGLGLSLVKNITVLHGGHVTAKSDGAGLGSTFTVTLPLVERTPDLALPSPLDASAATILPLTLMVVDDNLDAAQSLADLLSLDDHRVLVMEDGMSALAAPDRSEVQVFILDIGLPVMNGYELARRLRADPATSKAVLIALTGYGQAHDRVLTKTAGFDHHFVKPLDLDQLASVLEQVSFIERRKDL
ncbi:MAG: ATP-binding protein [Polaromonas sp.]